MAHTDEVLAVMHELGKHLAAQQGKSAAQLAKEYRPYAQRIGRAGDVFSIDDPPGRHIVVNIYVSCWNPYRDTPRGRKKFARDFRAAFRHLDDGTHPPMPTRFAPEHTPVYLQVFVALMEISRYGTLGVEHGEALPDFLFE
jgi:hypothetical protein